MMRKLWRLALLCLGILLAVAPAARAASGAVQGQVVNGTAGGPAIAADVPVRLAIYSGTDLKETRRATTDAQGMFRFDNVPVGSPWTAEAIVDYAGVEYSSALVDLTSGAAFRADVTVFETTADEGAIKVERSHLIIEAGAGQLEVTEMMILVNGGDRTFVGTEEVVPGRKSTVHVPLPAGATDASFADEEMNAAMVRTGAGFVDTRALAPGRRQYVLSYALPIEGSTFSLQQPVYYPTAALDVLVAAPGAEVNATLLESKGTSQAPGLTYQHLAGANLPKGADVLIRFSGLGQGVARSNTATPANALAPSGRPGWLSAGIKIVPGISLLALAAFLVQSLRKRVAGWAWQPEAAPIVASERERHLQQLAELDERYEAGDLEEAPYRRQRDAVKAELVSLLMSPQGKESDTGSDTGTHSGGHRASREPRKEVRSRPRPAQRRPKAG